MDRIGRYKIVRELGRGAMGVVYHALDPNIGRPVAIKTIRIGDERRPDEQQRLRERLLREARSAGSLSHPGIVTIYDVEQQGDLAYIAMEYVDGPTLDHVLSEGRPLPPEQIFSILGQTAAALDYAHQKGIVHRDIKPANIMIAADGTAKITDFGIAKLAATDQFTVTGVIVGTPHYMSPEQVQGQPVDGRSDQFSLAVIAYEVLTGEKPYTGEHLTTVVYKIVAEDPVSAHRLNPTLTGGIESVLRKALAKKPEGRYRTCQEFTEALEKACVATRGWKPMPRGGSLNAPTVADAAGVAAAPPAAIPKLPPARHHRQYETTEPAKRKTGLEPWLVALVLIAMALGGLTEINGTWLRQKLAALKPTAGVQPQPTSAPSATPQVTARPAAPTAAPDINEKPSPAGPPDQSHSTQTQAAKPAISPEIPDIEAPTPKARVKQPTVAREVKRTPARQLEPVEQEVTITSSPGGATATLDGDPHVTCKTPCTLEALPGRHTIAVTMPGYDVEHREVEVGTNSVEIPTVGLRSLGGTLYLASEPTGASISINGKKYSQVTNAQIPLPPGTYTVTVEKNGKQNTQTVTVQNGRLNLVKIPLE